MTIAFWYAWTSLPASAINDAAEAASDLIFAEGVREEGIGRALMNRLYKAASSVGEGM